jgi:predicted GNAT superfamily acetyltransferase
VDASDPAGAWRSAVVANTTSPAGPWRQCDEPVLPRPDVPWVVNVPPDFTRLLAGAPELALDWRLKTRRVFEHAFAAGLVVTAFRRDAHGGGQYLLTCEGPEP